MKAYAVIGANFGDEGKGLMTDYLCRNHDIDIVCRYNGGAQAGHTVQLSDGRRHVFHHYGSGTLAGVPTYLASRFICNPYLFVEETKDLIRSGRPLPSVYADPYCYVTTPYDMLLNQRVENLRKDQRHGSCGVGINETLVRSRHEPYPSDYVLYATDLINPNLVLTILNKIRREYVPMRGAELGLSAEDIEYCSREGFIDSFMERCAQFTSSVGVLQLSSLEGKSIVFEGAQGLALDMNYNVYFPHLTPSSTGSENIIEMVQALPHLKEMELIYMTRSYMTRHGAGPLPDECAKEALTAKVAGATEVVDATNLPHDFQGTLRFAPMNIMNLSMMRDRIYIDRCKWKTPDLSISVSAGRAVTCLDQIPHEYLENCPNTKYVSHGPTANDVAIKNRVSMYDRAREPVRSERP